MPLPHDLEEIGAEATALLGDEVVYVPVRHHSVACSWHLRKLIEERRPCAVLVEGPSDFTESIDLLLAPETRAPVAFYTFAGGRYAVGGATLPWRRAAYYPFCDYSPELVALREGRAIGAQLAFIDLPFAEQCSFHVAEDARDADDPRSRSLLQERWLERSAYLAELARRERCRDQNELWDHLFEVRHRTLPTVEFLKGVYAYCKIARSEGDAALHERDGTTAREHEMAGHIAAAIVRRRSAREEGECPGPILVVVGGYHSVALPALVAERVPRPSLDTTWVDERHSCLIRYSFDRLDSMSGYSAGMPSPAYYQRIWEDRTARWPRVLGNVALEFLSDVAAIAREQLGTLVPTTAVAAAYEQAWRLAHVRGHVGPARDDVFDAIDSCYVKGAIDAEGAPIRAAARKLLAGSTLGRVSPAAGLPPLVRDAEQRLRRQRLRIDDTTPHRAVLDIYRRADQRATSRLLHGLAFLGVPFARFVAGPDFIRGTGLDRRREQWEYAYSPATEASLVEAAVYGSTVPGAVAAAFESKLRALDSARGSPLAVTLLAQAYVLGLHDRVAHLGERLRRAFSEDADLASVAKAATHVHLLWQSRIPLEAGEHAETLGLLHAAYARGCFLLSSLAGVSDDAQPKIVDALNAMRDLAAMPDRLAGDPDLFWEALELLKDRRDCPMLAGAACGLLHRRGDLDDRALGCALEGFLVGAAAADAIAFLRGLLKTAREIAWQQTKVLQSLNACIGQWDDAQFMQALPQLRLAFADMTPRETDRIARAVAGLHNVPSVDTAVEADISAADAAALFALGSHLRAALAGDGLSAWLA